MLYDHPMSDAVFNLANGIDVEEMKQKVEKYKKENQALIMKNRARQVIHVCVIYQGQN